MNYFLGINDNSESILNIQTLVEMNTVNLSKNAEQIDTLDENVRSLHETVHPCDDISYNILDDASRNIENNELHFLEQGALYTICKTLMTEKYDLFILQFKTSELIVDTQN